MNKRNKGTTGTWFEENKHYGELKETFERRKKPYTNILSLVSPLPSPFTQGFTAILFASGHPE